MKTTEAYLPSIDAIPKNSFSRNLKQTGPAFLSASLRDLINLLQTGKPEDALAQCENILKGNPNQLKFYYARALILHHLHQDQDARNDLHLLLSHDPIHLKARELLRRLEFLAKPVVHIASYPRSGNTWLRLLLTDLILQIHGMDSDTRMPIPPEHVIPDLHESPVDVVDHRLNLPVRLAKTHDPAHCLKQHAIFLYRQPADSLVSFYHYHLLDVRLRRLAQNGIDHFCLDNLPGWIRHAESFLKLATHPERRALFVTYELLHQDPVTTLQRVGSFTGMQFEAEQCLKSIEHHRFDKLRQNQKKGNRNDINFFRQGKVDSAKTALKSETLQEITAQTSELFGQLNKVRQDQALNTTSFSAHNVKLST